MEARLIAAIPARPAPERPASDRTAAGRTSVRMRRIWPWALGAGMAAALVVAVVVSPDRDSDGVARRPGALRRSGGDSAAGVLRVHIAEETDPCNILPPLPDWR